MDWGKLYVKAIDLLEELQKPIPKDLPDKNSKELQRLIHQLEKEKKKELMA